MRLNNIITQRGFTTAAPFSIVFEWEDILSQIGGWKLCEISAFKFYKFFTLLKKLRLVSFYNHILRKNSLSLFFVMKADTHIEPILNKNVIPVIIDFWLEEKDLPLFYSAYEKCPLILVTSAEIYSFLKKHNCPLNIAHWPLSLPDSIRIENKENYKKQYELCFIGRPSPYFLEMLRIYESKHPDFEYVIGSRSSKNRIYTTNKGTFICNDEGRKSYLNMIRKSKITCYSTPGLDSNKAVTSTFNQVTPRLFEMIAGGCYVLAHYPDNEDTSYYELDKYVDNIPDYNTFEKKLDKLRRAEPLNMSVAREFLYKHYTSTRVDMLKKILSENNIEY